MRPFADASAWALLGSAILAIAAFCLVWTLPRKNPMHAEQEREAAAAAVKDD